MLSLSLKPGRKASEIWCEVTSARKLFLESGGDIQKVIESHLLLFYVADKCATFTLKKIIYKWMRKPEW